MKNIKKVLCVCKGNSDRSPVMAAILNMFLKSAGYSDAVVESAGILDVAEKGTAGKFAVLACKRFGIDISGHQRRRTTSLNLADYDLIICAEGAVVEEVIKQNGVAVQNVFDAAIANPWPVHFAEQYEGAFELILVAMARIMKFYFTPVEQPTQ